MNLKAILISSNIVFIIALFLSFKACEKFHNEASDYSVLLSKKDSGIKFKDKQGNEHLRKEAEVLNNGYSLKKDPEFQALLSLVKGIKPGNVVSASKTSITSEYHIKTTIRDSTINDTIKICRDYDSKFLSVHGCGDSLNVTSRDSIGMVIYTQRKKILFLRIGKKKYESELINFNPASTFTYSRNVVVKKR